MTFDPHQSDGANATVELTPGFNDANEPARSGRVTPYSIPDDQAYYWTALWQHNEGQALVDLAAGDFVEFAGDDPEDIVRWLNAD